MKYRAFLLPVVLLTSVLSITACSSDSDDIVASIDDNTVRSGATTLTTSGNNVSGTGSVIFDSSLGGVDSGKHFQVAALLDAGESFTLHAYADDQLANGIDLVVTRPANTQTSLEVTVDNADISAAFGSVSAEGTINILMDVHNDENPTHVLIWPAGETAFGEGTTLENSEDTGSVSSQGAGQFWGISLNGAEVTSAQASKDRFDD